MQLEREFNNKHDKNAVMVTNISGVQIGHLPRNVVTKLVPLLDGRIVTIEAVMHEGNCEDDSCLSSKLFNTYTRSDWLSIFAFLVRATRCRHLKFTDLHHL